MIRGLIYLMCSFVFFVEGAQNGGWSEPHSGRIAYYYASFLAATAVEKLLERVGTK